MSFLQEADSSLALLITVESSTSHSRKKGKKSSPVWAYTRQPLEHENQDFLYYSYCDVNDIIYKPYGSDSSSAMTKHINRKHPHITIKKSVSKNQEYIREQLKQFYRQTESNEDTKEFNLEILKSCLNVPALIKVLI